MSTPTPDPIITLSNGDAIAAEAVLSVAIGVIAKDRVLISRKGGPDLVVKHGTVEAAQAERDAVVSRWRAWSQHARQT
jgi:hypothetical protein